EERGERVPAVFWAASRAARAGVVAAPERLICVARYGRLRGWEAFPEGEGDGLVEAECSAAGVGLLELLVAEGPHVRGRGFPGGGAGRTDSTGLRSGPSRPT